MDDSASPPAILLVCTGNICRSAMAEGLLRTRLAARGVAASVSSTGLMWDGRAATADAVRAAAAYGVDIGAHASRLLDASQVTGADLILAMERRHVREIAVAAPESFGRTFTLRELVRRGEAIGPRPVGVGVAEWLAHAGAGRHAAGLLGFATDDDVADPYGRSFDVYERTAAELDGLLSRLIDLLWPAEPARQEQAS